MADSQNHVTSKLTGMFLDKHLEQQFQDSYLTRSKNYMRKVALIVGSIFSLYLVYDFSSNSQFMVLAIFFLCRLTFLGLSVMFYFKPDYFLKSSPFLKITIYQLIFIVLFFIIVMKYEDYHFLIQAFSINVIVLGIFFLVPNLLHYKVFLSLFALIGYMVITLTKYHPPLLEFSSVFGYLSLAIFFSSISSYSLGKYMRLDFVNKQYFKDLSTKDSLTNIYNRLKFNEALSSEIEGARRYGNSFSLIMFDIDHFKQFNDKNGHIFGDIVLIEIANLVKGLVRGVDVFARWGGEEFVILLPQTYCQEASALAERLRKSICKESMKKGMALTCSFGVTSFCTQDDEGLIMDRVDRALYKAKEGGRNAVVSEHNLHLSSSI
ncbi:GGDEF domain-containing protein [Desulfosporosinus nitroreducens]|uniref:GGDEF domain-containing protein n=1 Tax=Desulfosporosinus nitroreducens TaxID=2018668 RepID=A0ABT8QZF8_9FIRM|nr:GGDEF domain-containing protein [Desulfosporosinus nitroreducens]MCO1601675.1 GGDEF domain-containing protein [Desulfosporosinus nitroreducens]MDO0825256.1 GGDEF domain-containing protein [Desulfosporosinus nitroreducens]